MWISGGGCPTHFEGQPSCKEGKGEFLRLLEAMLLSFLLHCRCKVSIGMQDLSWDEASFVQNIRSAADLEVSVDSLLVTQGSTPATGSTPNLVGQSVGNSILCVSASANLVSASSD
ncbi:GTPase obg [Corchorus olitorius]|uniref:GTPase obg n=1 Tax=Corchorus olitorius TaxID=93759 RepID=A0A1R3KZJ9_9ROSI|nr:GTPase obg [Corchorus olitorius]